MGTNELPLANGITLAVIGQGYVGLPLAVRAAQVGYTVTGYDTNHLRIEQLASGASFTPDIDGDDIRVLIDDGRYHPTTDPEDLSGFDICVITVPTPLRDGAPDLSYVEAAGRTVAPHIRRGSVVILESTTYPGTTEQVLQPILEKGSGLSVFGGFHLGYSPERIDPGNETWRLENTPKIVSGVDTTSLAEVRRFYEDIVEEVVTVSSVRVAETAKLLENTFRHVNIALVNELAMFARQLHVDIWEVIRAAATKPFGFMSFTPGPGVGGHCLPIDPSYLSWAVKRDLGQPFRFVELANDINDRMPDHVMQRLVWGLNNDGKPLRNSAVLLVGLAYKKNTGDLRESPALKIAEQLHRLGATVLATDPYVEPEQLPRYIRMVPLSPTIAQLTDAAVVFTDHDCFHYEMLGTNPAYVLDTRHRCRPRPGLEYL